MAPVLETLPGFDLLPQVTEPVWGIDPSTKRIALAKLEPDYAGGTSLTWDTLSLAQSDRRLARAHADIAAWLPDDYSLQVNGGEPSTVFVEQPFAAAKHVHPQSYFMLGVLLSVLEAQLNPRVKIVTLTPTQWKAAALGKGHGFAKPPEYFAWAQRAGYQGRIEDEAAAVGIAVGGALLSRS